MKILFLNPPFKGEFGKYSREQRSPAVTKSGTFYYPMWLAYACGVAEESGNEVLLIDAPAKQITLNETYDRIKEFAPEIVVIVTSTPSVYHDVEIAAEIKNMTGAYIVMTGTHVSALPEETLKINKAIDAVCVEEYEITIKELAQYLDNVQKTYNQEGLSEIEGLVFRIGDNIIRNPNRKLIEDLDSIPFVSKTYKKYLDYKDYFYAHSKYPIVTILSGRGCPFQCVYCVYPQTFSGHKLRFRKVEKVVDEIEYILKNMPETKEIMFEDDTLTVNKSHITNFCNEIINRGLKFQWSANSRAQVDLKTLLLMKKAGCRLLCVGIESGVQEILNNMKKSIKIDQIRQFFKDAKKAKVKIHGCFLLGLPGATKESLKQTLDFALELNPDTAQFFPIMVYPGTTAYNWAMENGYLTTQNFKEWLKFDGMHNTVVSRPGLSSEDLVSFCDYARVKFYLRLSYIIRKLIQGITDFHELKRLTKGAFHLFKHILKG